MEVLAARDRGRDAPSARERVARRPAPWRGAKRRAVCAVAGVELDGAYLPRKRQRQTQDPAPRRTRGPAGATLRWPIRSAESWPRHHPSRGKDRGLCLWSGSRERQSSICFLVQRAFYIRSPDVSREMPDIAKRGIW